MGFYSPVENWTRQKLAWTWVDGDAAQDIKDSNLLKCRDHNGVLVDSSELRNKAIGDVLCVSGDSNFFLNKNNCRTE